jgi:hypothetical protein
MDGKDRGCLNGNREQGSRDPLGLTALWLVVATCAIAGTPASASAAPPTATTEAATAVRYHEATLEGAVNPEGSATSYWFEYGETTSYGTKIPISSKSVGSGTSSVSVSQPATGLNESTTYHFRVVAEGGGETVLGEDATFKTTGFESEFGKPGSGEGQLSEPFDLAVDSKGNIWVADTANNRVEEFSEKGAYISQFGREGGGNGEFKSPKGIAIDSENNLWVVDSGNDRLQKFNIEGKFILKAGEKGSGEGKFEGPTGIALDNADRPYVVDTGNNRIEKFSREGKYLAQFGKKGTGDGELMSPEGVLIDAKGRLWVVDTGNDRVQRFNGSTFGFISKFGKEGTGSGQFNHPVGISSDFQEKLWIVDSGNDRAQKFNIEGDWLETIGQEGTGPGQFKGPTGIATPTSQKLLILDAGNDRVQNWAVEAEPPRATTSPASNTTTTSTILHANLNPQAFTTSYWFEYGLTEAYGEMVPLTPESIGSGLSNVLVEQAITGLSKGTRYHFRVVAKSVAGTSFGIDRTVKTCEPPPATITEPATAIGSSQATLNGKVNPENCDTTYWFEYGTTEAYGTKIPLTPASVGSGVSYVAVSQTPTGLSKETEYHFRVVAESAAGTSKGADKAFTTSP